MAEFSPIGRRVAIYARVSTEEQREGQTIDSQIAELEAYARNQNFHVTGVYKDEGWSGGVMARPELDHLRDDAQKGVFQAVLINDVDRLARDVTHLGVIKRDLERNGVQVVFRKLPTESSPTHNLMVNILGSFAEFERELIADRTRRGRKHKVEVRKEYLGGNTSYGYRYHLINRVTGSDGFLQIVPYEASVIRQIYEWVDREQLSARKVLRRLNERGIRPPKNGPAWAKSSVLRVLRNEMYAGIWYYNKHEGYEPTSSKTGSKYRKHMKSGKRKRRREDWIPLQLPDSLVIIPRERWERVQLQITKNIAFSPRNQKHDYLLRGLIFCGGCGARYVGDPGHGKYSYRCIRRCRKCPTIAEEVLNEAVWGTMKRAILNPDLLLKHLQLIRHEEQADVKSDEQKLVALAQELRSLQTEEDRLLEAYRLSIISVEQLAQELEKLNHRRMAAKTDQAACVDRPEGASVSKIEKSVHEYCKEAAEKLNSFTVSERQQFLRTLIRSITFTGPEALIRAEIPYQRPDESSTSVGADPVTPTDSGIANTMTGHYGRNVGGEKLVEHPSHSIPFEIVTMVVRDASRVDAARRRNLVKANAARMRRIAEDSPAMGESRNTANDDEIRLSDELPRAA